MVGNFFDYMEFDTMENKEREEDTRYQDEQIIWDIKSQLGTLQLNGLEDIQDYIDTLIYQIDSTQC